MKFVYILEDDPRFQKEISDAIALIDPRIQTRIFSSLETFANWMKLMMTTGPSAIPKGGLAPPWLKQEPISSGEEHHLALIISKVEFLGAEQLNLLRRTRQLFIERKICTPEDPTAFVLTAFDNPQFVIRDLENRILNNIILKPFDRLILQQHLIFAIDGRHPPSKSTISNQKTTAVIELLKDVEMEAISDIGMVTKSYREIPLGAIAKYYGRPFLSDRHKSIFAVCRSCVPHPVHVGTFRCEFTFFGADHTQISNVRKLTRAKGSVPFEGAGSNFESSPTQVHVVIIDEEEAQSNGCQGYLERTFKNVKISTYPSFALFLADLDPAKALQDRAGQIKTLGGAVNVSLSFDPTGSTYLGLADGKTDVASLFGVPIAMLKDQVDWWSHALSQPQREKFRKLVLSGQVGDDPFFFLTVREQPFLVKIERVQKEKRQFTMVLSEPTEAEQVLWMESHSKLNTPVDLIIGHHRMFSEGAKERWGFVKDKLSLRFQISPKILISTKRDFTDAEERALGPVVEDILPKPVDRVYFQQKMKFFFPRLKEISDPIEVKAVQREELIKSANPVQVDEMSEAGLVMRYYRPIQLGSFRDFILWQPYEIGAPEMLATCNYVEESPSEKGVFKCHFVFFGASDSFLKHIRIWIRDNYVASKEGQKAS